MKNTKIEWTDHSHNFWWGCTKVSSACKHCYADTFSKRTGRQVFGKGVPRWQPSDKTRLGNPRKWNEEAKSKGIRYRVFTLSMGDFFDSEVDPSWREEAWSIIKETPHLDWLILTKRPENIKAMLPDNWGPNGWDNVWLGTTTEDQANADLRIPILTSIPAKVHFLSVEPLLEEVDLDLTNIDWVIVGGESGATPRPMKIEWVESIRFQCHGSNTAFFFKQWGGRSPKKNGRLLNDRTYDDFPLQSLSPNPLIYTSYDSKGNIVSSTYWDSLLCNADITYYSFEGGKVRLLCPPGKEAQLLEMRDAKATAITVATPTPDMAQYIPPTSEDVIEVFFDDKKPNVLLMHSPVIASDFIEELPKPGTITKLEVWELHNGKPRRRFSRKCLVRGGRLLNPQPILL